MHEAETPDAVAWTSESENPHGWYRALKTAGGGAMTVLFSAWSAREGGLHTPSPAPQSREQSVGWELRASRHRTNAHKEPDKKYIDFTEFRDSCPWVCSPGTATGWLYSWASGSLPQAPGSSFAGGEEGPDGG